MERKTKAEINKGQCTTGPTAMTAQSSQQLDPHRAWARVFPKATYT